MEKDFRNGMLLLFRSKQCIILGHRDITGAQRRGINIVVVLFGVHLPPLKQIGKERASEHDVQPQQLSTTSLDTLGLYDSKYNDMHTCIIVSV